MEAKCQNCQSSNIVRGVKIGVSADGGSHIYAAYKNKEHHWFEKEARIVGEICNDCGNVKLYVTETNKGWVLEDT
jgi:hypothetical protein